ncbi:Phage minor tail protein [Vibrio aerogenes CECT 7868]|uniref:Phage minor tail protein n=1 Tax=Vibrio aerogenes CECT 7868 TaxID=1216006 RepID=A0A1M6C1D0_9VIBR|nr:phage tail protein [Vibrio aerogenes]SHI54819.1 Phage minor tail protein [Vibrio aerogenes CECT 7868]
MRETFPDLCPDYNSGASISHDVVSVSFGDGYEQRMPKGINNTQLSYSLSWSGLTQSERDTLVDFLMKHGGVTPFYWTPWDGQTQLWICEKYAVSPKPANYYDISATFTKSYSL